MCGIPEKNVVKVDLNVFSHLTSMKMCLIYAQILMNLNLYMVNVMFIKTGGFNYSKRILSFQIIV